MKHSMVYLDPESEFEGVKYAIRNQARCLHPLRAEGA